MLRVRALEPGDTDAFLRIRREALETDPAAFESSVGDDRGLDPAFVREMLGAKDGRAVIGAFDPGLVGIVGVYRDSHLKAAHKAHVWGMFVRLGARGRGVGGALLSAAIRHAREMRGVRQVHLSVSERAAAALRLYERAGFVVWGTEPRALLHGGALIGEHHMVLALD